MTSTLARLTIAPAALGLLAASLFCRSFAAEPVGWRADGRGSFPNAQPPLSWAEDEGIVWSTDLPAFGNATPILVRGRLFVASEIDELICLDPADGRILWSKASPEETFLTPEEIARREAIKADLAPTLAERNRIDKERNQVRRELRGDRENEDLKQREKALQQTLNELEKALAPLRAVERPASHGVNGYSSPTPTTDGERVFAMFGTGVTAAFSLDGERLWGRLVDKPRHGWGHSASPLLAGGRLILAYGDIFGLDPATGDEVWRTPSRAHWGSPVATEIDGVAVVVSCEGQLIRAADGKVFNQGLVSLEYNSPLVVDGVVYTFDREHARAHRLPAALTEDAAVELLWETPIAKERYYASPALVDGIVYGINQRSVLTAVDAQTGEKLFEERLDLGRGTIYPSPTVAGGWLFVSSDNGTTAVVKPGRVYEEFARNSLAAFRSCPTFVGPRLYLRALKKLYCIGE